MTKSTDEYPNTGWGWVYWPENWVRAGGGFTGQKTQFRYAYTIVAGYEQSNNYRKTDLNEDKHFDGIAISNSRGELPCMCFIESSKKLGANSAFIQIMKTLHWQNYK